MNRPEHITEDMSAPAREILSEGRHGQAVRAIGAVASRSTTSSEGGDFPFTLPDRGAIWMRLALNASQVAHLCGVTLRQVIHWADRGYLPRSPHDSGAFSGQAVDM